MLTIEFESPEELNPCECCGGRTISLTRFVYSDGDAHAVYYARLSSGHPDRVVVATISLGEWGEGSTDKDRVAFAIELRADANEYQVGMIDAEFSPWCNAKTIGRTLDREEALVHPMVKEAFHITDHMVTEDKEIYEYLSASVE